MHPHLFSPLTLNGVELRNRVVFGPHVTMFGSADSRPTRRDRFYYEERARGGVGLIVTGSQFVHETSRHSRTIDASRREVVAEWRETIDAVHRHGTKIFAQLTHHGIEMDTRHTRREQWGPSPVPNPAAGGEVPKPMTLADVAELEAAFARSAGWMVETGFDGVELKVGHDGLLRTFLSPYFNRREDAYGGPVENRMRLALETLAAVRDQIGPDVPLGIRFCMDEGFPGGYGLDDALVFAERFAASGLLDYVNTDMGTWLRADLQVPPMTVPQGFALAATARVKQVVGDLPVVAFGRIKDPAMAEEALASGGADLIGLVRPLLTDPEWAAKAQRGDDADIRPCVACGQECIGRLVHDLPIGCVHNPAAGDEERLGSTALTPAEEPRRVVVVGGGPGGMKAAETAALRGHEVVLLERADVLGGQVVYAARAPEHGEWGEMVTHLAGRLERLGVDVRLGVDADAETVLALDPGAIVVATGAEAGPPLFDGDGMAVLDEFSVLSGEEPAGLDVVLLDHGVRFEGSALAETLAARGNRVHWVTPAPTVAFQVDPTTMLPLRRRIAEHGVDLRPESTVVAAHGDTVTLLNAMAGTTEELSGVEAVVVAGAKAPRGALAGQLEQAGVEVHAVGDCVAPRHVAAAMRDGMLAGLAV